MSLKNKFFSILFITALTFSSLLTAAVNVDPTNYTGSRSTSLGGGLFGTGPWSAIGATPLNLSWNIDNSGPGGSYHYTYTISGPGGVDLAKNISHFILEVSPTITPDNVASLITDASSPFIGPQTFSPLDPGNSNPGLPGSIYGIKINVDSLAKITFDFFSERSPIWGDFYVRDGKSAGLDVYAYNSGFGLDPTGLSLNFTPWVPTPDTVSVPEPGTWLILSSILGFVAVMQAYRTRAKVRVK